MIKRELKGHIWEFDEEKKEISILIKRPDLKTGIGINLDKTRWFSLFRFMIRASQRMSTQRRKKK